MASNRSYGMEQTCRYCWKTFYAEMLKAGCSSFCSHRLSAYNRQIEKSRWDMTGKEKNLPGMGKQVELAIEHGTV